MALTARLENGHITVVQINRINKQATTTAQDHTLTLITVVHALTTSPESQAATPATTLTIITAAVLEIKDH